MWEALNHWNEVVIRREAMKRIQDSETVESQGISNGCEIIPIFVYAQNN